MDWGGVLQTTLDYLFGGFETGPVLWNANPRVAVADPHARCRSVRWAELFILSLPLLFALNSVNRSWSYWHLCFGVPAGGREEGHLGNALQQRVTDLRVLSYAPAFKQVLGGTPSVCQTPKAYGSAVPRGSSLLHLASSAP